MTQLKYLIKYKMSVLRITFLLVSALLACKKPAVPPSEIADISKQRSEKDAYFLSNESPLSDSLKKQFYGLSYFSEDSTYRFWVKLNKYDNPRELEMLTSKGKRKHYIEYGYFEFELDGKNNRLNVFKANPPIAGHENYLFIPFKDATTGKETYDAGRYLDLEEKANDMYVLDFNLAYNPWCAYSDNYNCPYPPKENILSIAVRAGEKSFEH